jgi:hypothetical protein
MNLSFRKKLMATCALCRSEAPLIESHIIPHFVFDRIKKNSPTGYLRGGLVDVNLRRQDGDTGKLLCQDCEQRFSNSEREFNERVLAPYHEQDLTVFEYGPWLGYFISSVNWRTLHLDNIGFHREGKSAVETLHVLDGAERILADFLLGRRSDIGEMENHILPMFEITHAEAPLEEPNFYFRASAFSYTFFVPSLQAFYVCANLAGVLIFTVIRRGKNDLWENTLVNLKGDVIKPPYHITSPLIPHMIQLLADSSKVQVSDRQRDKITTTLVANPKASEAKAVRIRNLDTQVRKE